MLLAGTIIFIFLLRRCRYTAPKSEAVLKVDVKLHGRHISDSPFTVPVEPRTPPQSVYFQLYPEDYCLVNQPITAILDASEAITDGSHKNFHLELKYGQHTEKIEPSHKDTGEYDVCFTPTEEGTYYLNVKYDGVPIPENGIKFEVKKTEVFIVDYPKTGLIYQPITVTLNACSDFIRHNLLKAHVQNGQGSILPHSRNGDIVKVTYVPHTVGKHEMKIQYDGEYITDAPLEFEVTSSCLPKLSVKGFSHNGDQCQVRVSLLMEDVTLEGFKRMSAHSSQESGSPYYVKAVGEKTGHILYPAEFRCVKDGEFGILFLTTVPDDYLLSVYYYEQLIPCCPFPLDITSHVTYYDPVVPFQVAPSNAIELVLDTSEAPAASTSTDDFKIQVSPSDSFEGMRIVEEAPELFRISFQPSKDDDFSIKISWFCLPITSSPISIPFKQRDTKPLISVSFEPHMGSRVSIAAKLLDNNGNGKKHLQAELRPKPVTDKNGPSESFSHDGSRVQDDKQSDECSYSLLPAPRIALQQFKRGQYEIWFRDYERGHYFLHVYCFGQELKGSPFYLDTTSKTPAKPPRKRGKMQVVKLKNQRLGRGQMGILAASVTGRNVGPVKISLAVTENNDLAVVKFNDRHPHDIYDLCIYWNYKEFLGSPFELTKHYESAQKK